MNLWPHQKTGVEFILNAGSGGLWFSMRTGKSLTALAVGLEAKAERVLILAPRVPAKGWLAQIREHLNGSDFPAPILLNEGSVTQRVEQLREHWVTHRGRLTAIMNYEAATREPMRAALLACKWPLLIMDEVHRCFVAGTLVETPYGKRAIESLHEGDEVLGYDHKTARVVISRVRATMQSESANLVSVRGTICTADHPFWTPGGYRALRPIDVVACIDYKAPYALYYHRVRVVRPTPADLPEAFAGEAWQGEVLRPILFSEVANEQVAYGRKNQRENEDAEGKKAERRVDARLTQSGRRTKEAGCSPLWAEQPNKESGCKETCAGGAGSERMEAPERREWKRPDYPSENFMGGASRRMGDGVSNRDEAFAGQVAADELQSRFSVPPAMASGRGGWAWARNENREGARHEEGCRADKVGVDGYSREELRGDGVPVFNIETDTGNYFAGEMLVHNCKGPTSLTSKFMRDKLRQRAEHRIGLSGTPTPQGYVDYFGVYSALSRDVFGLDYWTHFKRRYVVCGNPRIPQMITGFRDTDEIDARVKRWAISVREEDCWDVPIPEETWLWVDLCDKTRRAYNAMEAEMIAECEHGEIVASNALVKALRLQQLAGGVAVTGEHEDAKPHRISEEKGEELAGFLEDRFEPVVVFAQFLADLDIARSVAAKLGRPYSQISAGLDGEAEFHKAVSDGLMPIIGCQIQAGSEGIELSDARIMVFLSTGYASMRYQQARARIKGHKQKHRCNFVHIGARNTIDEAVAQALEKKLSFEQAVLARLHYKGTA